MKEQRKSIGSKTLPGGGEPTIHLHISCRREARLFLLLSVEEGWNRASVGFVGFQRKGMEFLKCFYCIH